jgi:hypothetical protein
MQKSPWQYHHRTSSLVHYITKSEQMPTLSLSSSVIYLAILGRFLVESPQSDISQRKHFYEPHHRLAKPPPIFRSAHLISNDP